MIPRLSFCLAGILAALLVASVSVGAQRVSSSPSPALPPGHQAVDGYVVGDRLRVNIFEQLDVPQAAAGTKSRDTMRAYYQRVDLGGEYQVEADGTLNLPRLGRIPVAGRPVDQVRDDIAAALQKETGRYGDVHVAILERQPVYIVGHVRQPGSFRFVPGMIVIQAIALAGGTDRLREQDLTAVDASRERERWAVMQGKFASLLARRAILIAIRDRKEASVPAELTDLVGPARARELVETERRANDQAAQERAGEARRLTAIVAASRDELKVMQATAEQARRVASARQAEIDRISEPDHRLTNRQLVSSLQAEATDLSLKARQYQMSASQTEQRSAQVSGELARLDLKYRSDMGRELAAAEQEITTLRQSISSAALIADQIQTRAGEERGVRLDVEIVRQTGGQPRTLPALVTTALQPGDVVQVKASNRRDASGEVPRSTH